MPRRKKGNCVAAWALKAKLIDLLSNTKLIYLWPPAKTYLGEIVELRLKINAIFINFPWNNGPVCRLHIRSHKSSCRKGRIPEGQTPSLTIIPCCRHFKGVFKPLIYTGTAKLHYTWARAGSARDVFTCTDCTFATDYHWFAHFHCVQWRLYL